jgi:hypothetical protein
VRIHLLKAAIFQSLSGVPDPLFHGMKAVHELPAGGLQSVLGIHFQEAAQIHQGE